MNIEISTYLYDLSELIFRRMQGVIALALLGFKKKIGSG